MTTINSQEDFLRALRENPEWKDAVRALILGEELLQLPTRFNAFVDEQRQVNKRIESDISDLKAGQVELRAGVQQLQAGQGRIETRMDRMEYDNSTLKGWYAASVAQRSAETLSLDLGLEYVRTLSEADLDRMIRAVRPDLPVKKSAASGGPTWSWRPGTSRAPYTSCWKHPTRPISAIPISRPA